MLLAASAPPAIRPPLQYPLCIVWTPIHPITAFLPFVGHLGIATSHGEITDFAGPYTVNKGRFAFGDPTRYIQLDPKRHGISLSAYDAAVEQAGTEFKRRLHCIVLPHSNCHSHVALALENMAYPRVLGVRWNMVLLAAWVTLFGRFTNTAAAALQFAPFCVLVLLAYLLWG